MWFTSTDALEQLAIASRADLQDDEARRVRQAAGGTPASLVASSTSLAPHDTLLRLWLLLLPLARSPNAPRFACFSPLQVTDAEGRRRFHGAFTGGFSAGYFNSVGSKEGWQPTTLSSSRRERAPPSRFQQRAEDFMDEEDDPLLGRRLETTERYDTLQADAKRALQQDQRSESAGNRPAPIPGFALPDEWVLPANNSVGVALLRRMGWKEGQGIGQRVRKRKTHARELSDRDEQDQTDESRAEEEGESVYVPPRNNIDVKTAFPAPKVDRYGAGFDPYVSAPEFTRYKQQQSLKSGEAQRDHRQIVTFADAMKPTTGSYRAVTGYGLGALEENDDLDVYGTESMAEFDTEIGPLRLGAPDATKLLANVSEADEAKRRRRVRSVCSDGRKPLPGFELARATEKPPKAVAARLQVPKDFKPFHVFDDEEDGDGHAVSALYRQHNFSTMQHGRGSTITVKERAALLGTSDAVKEQKQIAVPPGSTSSVFDLMASEDKLRLMDAVSRAKAGAATAAAAAAAGSVAHREPNRRDAPAMDAKPATRARQPLVQGSSSDQLRATISASIAKRFVSSAVEGGDVPTTGSEPASTNMDPASSTTSAPAKKCSHRSQSAWVPSALLCKRFRVKCVGATSRSGDDGGDRKRDLFAQELVPQLVEFAAGRGTERASAAAVAPREPSSTASRSARKEEEDELPPLPEIKRPAANLLKSIFEPSDESDGEETSEGEGNESESDDSVHPEEDKQQPAPSQPAPHNDDSRGRRGAADYFSSDSSSSEDEQTAASGQVAGSSAPHAPDRKSEIDRLAPREKSEGDSRSDSDDEPKRKKRKKHRHRDGEGSDAESDRRARKKRSKKDKKHKKHKRDRKDKKTHRESSRSRRRSRSRSRSASRYDRR